jgi:hypothetical protein
MTMAIWGPFRLQSAKAIIDSKEVDLRPGITETIEVQDDVIPERITGTIELSIEFSPEATEPLGILDHIAWGPRLN